MLRWIVDGRARDPAVTLPALAQPFPSKTVHLIVAYAPGGTGDVVARVIADKLGPALGQTRRGGEPRRRERRDRRDRGGQRARPTGTRCWSGRPPRSWSINTGSRGSPTIRRT